MIKGAPHTSPAARRPFPHGVTRITKHFRIPVPLHAQRVLTLPVDVPASHALSAPQRPCEGRTDRAGPPRPPPAP